MIRLLLVLLCVLKVSLSIAQDGYKKSDSIDIIRYQFGIRISDDHDTIQGNSVVEFETSGNVSALGLDLFGLNGEGRGMQVIGVSQNGKSLKFEHNKERLIIYGNFVKGPNALNIKYQGVPADGLIISKNKYGQRTFFCDNWPNRAHHYIPVVDHPSEKAYSSFKIEAPAKYQVVSNGKLVNSVDLLNGYRITTWKSEQILPTKVMVFGAAEFAVGRCDHNDIPIYAWVYPQEMENGFKDYCRTTDILKWFENKIAAYPYEELSNVQSKTRYGGMENAGCIFYHENSIDGKGSNEDLYAHELAHQWFGNSASEADWHHVWLSEGFATYLTEVYKQETYGDSVFYQGMARASKRVKLFAKKFPNATIVDTSIENLNRLLNPYTYQRAAWLLHMLRQYVGDQVFWKGVRSYYQEFQFGNAWSKDFQSIMEKESGMDLSSFFEAWLYQPGFPQISGEVLRKDGKRYLRLSQSQSDFFPVMVKLYMDFKDKSKLQDEELHMIRMDKPIVLVPIEHSLKLLNLTIDPNKDILR